MKRRRGVPTFPSPQVLAKRSFLGGSRPGGGTLPLGRFGEVADQQLQATAIDYEKKCANFGVKTSDLFQIQLHKADVKQFYIAENDVGLHALKVQLDDGSEVAIHGVIDFVSPDGLLVPSKSYFADRIKVWPLILVTALLDVCAPRAHFLESGKTLEIEPQNAHKALSRYLEYFLKAQFDPSPLIPAWSSALLTKEFAEFKMADLEDPYVNWIFWGDDKINIKEIFSRWQPDLQYVFEDLLDGEL